MLHEGELQTKSAVVLTLQLCDPSNGCAFAGTECWPIPVAPSSTCLQVVTLLSSATQVLGDPDGGLAALQADSEAWLAEHAHRAWPCRQFASLDRAVQVGKEPDADVFFLRFAEWGHTEDKPERLLSTAVTWMQTCQPALFAGEQV
jgi:hypothetical protein